MKLGPAVPAGTFASAHAATANRIPFAHPDPGPPSAAALAGSEPSTTK